MATRRRSTATTVAVLAAAAVAVPLLSACGAVQKTLDCANTAATFAGNVDTLQRSLGNADSPQDAQNAVDQLNKDLGKLKKQTDNADVEKAIGDLTKAVDAIDDAVRDGKTPDLTGLKDATSELTKVCTPG